VLTDGYRLPMGLAVDEDNRVDFKIGRETQSIAADRLSPARRVARVC